MIHSPLDATTALILGEESNLHRFAHRFARCESDCDDLVQETLLRAYNARRRFKPGTSVRAWTTTILRRVFLTAAIRARRRGIVVHAGDRLDSAVARNTWPHGDTAPSMAALRDRLDERVKHALDRVPEIHRDSFFLSAVRELSCEEIGRQLRVPAGTVMSRVHRARERLKEDLAPHRRELAPTARRGR